MNKKKKILLGTIFFFVPDVLVALGLGAYLLK